MTTLNVTVDDQVASRAQRVAMERNTTLDDLVKEFLEQLTSRGLAERAASADRLAETIRSTPASLGTYSNSPAKA